MAGEVITALFRRQGFGVPAGTGVTTIPGPGILLAARYQTSPIGPFTEVAIIEPLRHHPARLGLGVTCSVVDDERACREGRVRWGLPREVGTLGWEHRDGAVRVTWAEEGLVVDAVSRWGALPVLVPIHLLQHRGPDAIVVPMRLRGLARPARITIESPDDGRLARLAGRHRGLMLAAPHVRIDPAVIPAGWSAIGRLGRATRPVAPGLGPNA